MIIHKILLGFFVSLLVAFSALAQVATAELSGTVLDASGAALPKARVTATNAETNVVVRQTETGAAGEYCVLPAYNFCTPGRSLSCSEKKSVVAFAPKSGGTP